MLSTRGKMQEQKSDFVVQETAPWPAVVVFQDLAALWQANMTEQQWTCYIGQDKQGPSCSTMDASGVAGMQLKSCNCSESRDQNKRYNFINDTKRFISFNPPPNLVAGDVQIFLNLVVNFNCQYQSSRREGTQFCS